MSTFVFLVYLIDWFVRLNGYVYPFPAYLLWQLPIFVLATVAAATAAEDVATLVSSVAGASADARHLEKRSFSYSGSSGLGYGSTYNGAGLGYGGAGLGYNSRLGGGYTTDNLGYNSGGYGGYNSGYNNYNTNGLGYNTQVGYNPGYYPYSKTGAFVCVCDV